MGMRRRLATSRCCSSQRARFAAARERRGRSSRATCGSTSSPTSRRTTLPRERPAPITVEVGGKISTTDGSQPAAAAQPAGRTEQRRADRIARPAQPARASLLQSTSSGIGARPLPAGAGRRRHLRGAAAVRRQADRRQRPRARLQRHRRRSAGDADPHLHRRAGAGDAGDPAEDQPQRRRSSARC